MSVKERIKKFIQTQGITVIEFERTVSASNGYVNSIHKSIGIDKLNNIIEKYPILNIEWLLTGNGSMLKDVPPTKEMSPEEYFNKPVPSAAPEPAPTPNDGSIPYIMRRYEELIAENALLKKENEDLKLSRGKAFDDDIYTKFSTKITSDNPAKTQ